MASAPEIAAVRVGAGRAVDLGRERAEALLVRHRLRGQRHRQQRAAVERLVEGDDGLPARGVARDLDRVLDGLRAGVHEQALVRAGAGVDLAEALDDLDVRLVLRDGVALVEVALGLLLDRAHDPLGRVAAVERADAADEVDVLAAVDVDQSRAVRTLDEHRRRGDRGRDPLLALRDQRRGAGAHLLADGHWSCSLRLGGTCAVQHTPRRDAECCRDGQVLRVVAHIRRPFLSTVERPPMLPCAHGVQKEVDMASTASCGAAGAGAPPSLAALHADVRPGGRAAGRDRARRGAVRRGHQREALPRLPVRPLHGADRLLARRGAGPGGAGAGEAAPVLHELDVRPPAARSSSPPSWPRSRPRASAAASSSRAARRRSRPPSSWPASTTTPAASPRAARSSRARSRTTARPTAPSR